MIEAKGRKTRQNYGRRVIRNLEESNKGSPKQGLTSAKDLTVSAVTTHNA